MCGYFSGNTNGSFANLDIVLIYIHIYIYTIVFLFLSSTYIELTNNPIMNIY